MASNSGEAAAPAVFKFSQIDWDDPSKSSQPGKGPPEELVAKAKKSGAVRKKVVRGEGGFFMNRSSLPPGFRIPPHTHSHDELIVILKGGCELDGGLGELEANDSIVLHANYRYGFTCGSEGMEFLTIRIGEADTKAS
ncbi:MAG: cupin domain-containing protein [Deltaproteobacteria bacterium]|jgi:quercetin dioxygenase-like cupin family protein|nr:cupin domain-containing protein [Deltaproteobacteria bacterium]MBW2500720.1 cupin domain-containing protein [Deltaproteobacteria bacterium]